MIPAGLIIILLSLFSVCYGADQKPIELRFSTHIPPFAPPVKVYKQWAEDIKQATDGRVQITVYAGGTLMQLPDSIAGVKSGIAHMALIVTDIAANERPLTPILQLPFLGLGDWQAGSKMMAQLRNEFPELNAEYSDFKILFREIRTGMGIHTNFPLRVPSDLKGKKIIARGMNATIINTVGGAAMDLDVPDWYTSLDRGLADGIFMDTGAMFEMKLYQLLPYHADFANGMNLQLGIIIMNQKTWDALPSDIQKIIDDISQAMELKIAETTVEKNKQYVTEMKKIDGQKFTILNDEEAELWLKAAGSEHEKYLTKAEAKGLPARAIYQRAIELSRQYQTR